MKFYINTTQIKTVKKGASIEGSLNSVSRIASFSYIYDSKDPNFKDYKARTGFLVLIKNDSNENIFIGLVLSLSYDANSMTMSVTATDLFSVLLNKKIAGRFKGDFITIFNKVMSGYKFTSGILDKIQKFMQKDLFVNFKKLLDGFSLSSYYLEKYADKLNVISLGNLSAYDILSIAASKIYGDEFKFYIDGNCRINILLPLYSPPVAELFMGKDIISSSFSVTDGQNRASIMAFGNDKVVAGTTVRIIDPSKNVNGNFVVENDSHIYTNAHTMQLGLRERVTKL